MAKWTSEEISILNTSYGIIPTVEIAKKVNKTVHAVRDKAKIIRPNGITRLPRQIKQMDTQNRIYIAGLFDADGTVGIYLNRKRLSFTIRVGFSTVYREFADWISETTGLNKTVQLNTRLGRTYFYEISTGSKQKVLDFLIQIRDYVILKKDQIDVAVRWINNEIPDEEASLTLKALKRKA